MEDCRPQRQQLQKMLKNTLLRNRWPLYSITIHHQVTVDGFIQWFADRQSFHVLNRFWSISIPYFDVDRDRILDPIFWRCSGSYDRDPSTEKFAKYFWIFWNVAKCLEIYIFFYFLDEEEIPPEAKMRMRNVGRETITSSGPNSFGKTKQGFTDANKLFERQLKEAMDEVSNDKQ